MFHTDDELLANDEEFPAIVADRQQAVIDADHTWCSKSAYCMAPDGHPNGCSFELPPDDDEDEAVLAHYFMEGTF